MILFEFFDVDIQVKVLTITIHIPTEKIMSKKMTEKITPTALCMFITLDRAITIK